MRKQLQGVEIDGLKGRAQLAAIPVFRKGELTAAQADAPPFGGLAATRPARLKRLLVSPGPIFEPEGHGARLVGRGARLPRGGRAARATSSSTAFPIT